MDDVVGSADPFTSAAAAPFVAAAAQGLTLVHFSARRKRFLWDRGCI